MRLTDLFLGGGFLLFDRERWCVSGRRLAPIGDVTGGRLKFLNFVLGVRTLLRALLRLALEERSLAAGRL